ncbi:MAG: NAD-dependent epimerase/dehydratase family protein [Candidatus Lokiarchaeota archaeon]|nr:NAD-dependent epimerase/dehydratase family protein [Candidatus Lokiarchaeota archaeon]
MGTASLVTGANGYIGSHLVDRLLAGKDDKVVAMVLKGTDESNLNDAKKSPKFSVVYADLMDPASLEKACGGIDTVYHLAALVTDWAPKELYTRVIVGGTRNVVDAAIKVGVKRLVYMSSLVVHGLGGHVDADENTPIEPVPFFPYAVAKAEAEALLQGVIKEGKLEVVIVRPGFDIIGPRSATTFVELAGTLEKGRYAFMAGGRKLITLVNVKNLAAGMAHVGAHPAAAGEAYVITDASWTHRKYAEEICERLGSVLKAVNVPYALAVAIASIMEGFARLFRSKKGPVLNRYRVSIPRNDIDFTPRKLLSTGFVPPFSIEQGLDEAVAWYKARKSALAASGENKP